MAVDTAWTTHQEVLQEPATSNLAVVRRGLDIIYSVRGSKACQRLHADEQPHNITCPTANDNAGFQMS